MRISDWSSDVCSSDLGFAALGIASFGPLDLAPRSPRYGHILATNKPGWSDADVLGEIASPFAVPVGFDTDVNGAALAEIRWGAGQEIGRGSGRARVCRHV